MPIRYAVLLPLLSLYASCFVVKHQLGLQNLENSPVKAPTPAADAGNVTIPEVGDKIQPQHHPANGSSKTPNRPAEVFLFREFFPDDDDFVIGRNFIDGTPNEDGERKMPTDVTAKSETSSTATVQGIKADEGITKLRMTAQSFTAIDPLRKHPDIGYEDELFQDPLYRDKQHKIINGQVEDFFNPHAAPFEDQFHDDFSSQLQFETKDGESEKNVQNGPPSQSRSESGSSTEDQMLNERLQFGHVGLTRDISRTEDSQASRMKAVYEEGEREGVLSAINIVWKAIKALEGLKILRSAKELENVPGKSMQKEIEALAAFPVTMEDETSLNLDKKSEILAFKAVSTYDREKAKNSVREKLKPSYGTAASNHLGPKAKPSKPTERGEETINLLHLYTSEGHFPDSSVNHSQKTRQELENPMDKRQRHTKSRREDHRQNSAKPKSDGLKLRSLHLRFLEDTESRSKKHRDETKPKPEAKTPSPTTLASERVVEAGLRDATTKILLAKVHRSFRALNMILLILCVCTFAIGLFALVRPCSFDPTYSRHSRGPKYALLHKKNRASKHEFEYSPDLEWQGENGEWLD